MRSSPVAAAAFAGLVAAQGAPANTTICDYYTTALLKNNTAANQATILTLLVNTVVIGNYTKPVIPGVKFPDMVVPGILDSNATYMGKGANLLPYFDGGLASTNRGGMSGVTVNFLDDGGAVPLAMNKPANGTSSNQYKLLTHLYGFFGSLLGCSQQGMTGFDAYGGDASMYSVHKFMALNSSQVGYFISQVGAAAESFGVAQSDITKVATALEGLFDMKCSAAATAVKAQGPQLQAICITDDCTMATNATCGMYAAVSEPGVANATLAMGEGNATSTATGSAAGGGMASSTASGSAASSGAATGTPTGTAAAGKSSGAAVQNVGGVLAAGGLAAFAFFL